MTDFVQRWRIVFRRPAGTQPVPHRDLAERWLAGLERAALPGRLVVAVPMPTGMQLDRELADLWLPERRTAADVRAGLGAALPGELELVDVYDVWIGEPALPGRIAGADYRVRLATAAGLPELERAARALVEAPALPRRRVEGDRTVQYDLRPLLVDVGPVGLRDGALELDVRVRHSSELGVGRPEEVVAALAERSGLELPVAAIRRLRVLLADEIGRV